MPTAMPQATTVASRIGNPLETTDAPHRLGTITSAHGPVKAGLTRARSYNAATSVLINASRGHVTQFITGSRIARRALTVHASNLVPWCPVQNHPMQWTRDEAQRCG